MAHPLNAHDRLIVQGDDNTTTQWMDGQQDMDQMGFLSFQCHNSVMSTILLLSLSLHNIWTNRGEGGEGALVFHAISGVNRWQLHNVAVTLTSSLATCVSNHSLVMSNSCCRSCVSLCYLHPGSAPSLSSTSFAVQRDFQKVAGND